MFSNINKDNARWVENPEAVGLRLVGLAHDIGIASYEYAHAAVDHKGWWLDPDGCDETVSGVVYQLAGRNGRARYLYGYADPYNTDSDGVGPAFLSMDILEGERLDSGWEADSVMRDAARLGDAMAESYADIEREYQAGWRAGSTARNLASESVAACQRWIQATRAARAVFRNRHRISKVDAKLLMKAQTEQARDYCEEFLEARESARVARTDAPSLGYGGLATSERDGWLQGYSEGANC